jgi:hypothetical protein
MHQKLVGFFVSPDPSATLVCLFDSPRHFHYQFVPYQLAVADPRLGPIIHRAKQRIDWIAHYIFVGFNGAKGVLIPNYDRSKLWGPPKGLNFHGRQAFKSLYSNSSVI